MPLLPPTSPQQLERQALLARVPSCTPATFDALALDLFASQGRYNAVYAQYIALLRIAPASVATVEQIPFLPISLYKTHAVTCLPAASPVRTFASSRTSGQVPSQHLLYDLTWYHTLAIAGFERFFGPITQYAFLSLLPSYAQGRASSLVEMVHAFGLAAGSPLSAQAANTPAALAAQLEAIAASGRTPVVFGVTHALLALAAQGTMAQPCIVFETGGMKGRGPELTRPQLHATLAAAMAQATLLSEYGMTELLSQGYTLQSRSTTFATPPWLRLLLTDPRDPLDTSASRTRGQLSVIDLANVDSCAFVATQDVATRTPAGIEVLGRADDAELRGCNLLEWS